MRNNYMRAHARMCVNVKEQYFRSFKYFLGRRFKLCGRGFNINFSC